MYYYLWLITAWILGQFFYTAVIVWKLQDGKVVPYTSLVKQYVRGDIGGYVASVILMLIVIFVLPELINIHMSRLELLEKHERTLAEKVQVYFRCACTLLGIFSQHLSYVLYKGGKNRVDAFLKSKGLLDETQTDKL